MFEDMNKARAINAAGVYKKIVQKGLTKDTCDRCDRPILKGFVRGKWFQERGLNGKTHYCVTVSTA